MDIEMLGALVDGIKGGLGALGNLMGGFMTKIICLGGIFLIKFLYLVHWLHSSLCDLIIFF